PHHGSVPSPGRDSPVGKAERQGAGTTPARDARDSWPPDGPTRRARLRSRRAGPGRPPAHLGGADAEGGSAVQAAVEPGSSQGRQGHLPARADRSRGAEAAPQPGRRASRGRRGTLDGQESHRLIAKSKLVKTRSLLSASPRSFFLWRPER